MGSFILGVITGATVMLFMVSIIHSGADADKNSESLQLIKELAKQDEQIKLLETANQSKYDEGYNDGLNKRMVSNG